MLWQDNQQFSILFFFSSLVWPTRMREILANIPNVSCFKRSLQL